MADLEVGLGLPEAADPPAAPATETPTAEHAAIESKDFSAFREARRVARRPPEAASPAAPAATIAAPPDAAPAAPTPAALPDKDPRRHVRQSEINEQIRRAVEQATAPLLAQIRQPPAPAAPTAPAAAPTPDWKRYAALPGAPKIDQFDTLDEANAAMALFVAEQRDQERAHAQAIEQHEARFKADGEAFKARMDKAAEADATLPTDLFEKAPSLLAAKPLSNLKPGERATFGNAAAEVLFRSEHPGTLARYLIAHPEEINAIGTLPEQQWLLALSRLDGRLAAGTIQAPAPASVTPPRPATPPPTTLGTRASAPVDPEHAALASGDFTAFRRARLSARLADRV